MLLVVAAFVLLTGSFVGAFGGAERGFAGIVSPIQEGASKAAKPVRDLVNWVGDTFNAKSDLEEVRAERDALRVANGQLVGRLSTVVERTELNRIAATASLDRYGPIQARLIGSSPSAWYRNIQIDKGSRDGVDEGNPVIGPNGLAGRVIRVQGGSSIVRLITDPESGVTAKVINRSRPNGLRGPLRPSTIGAAGDLTLEIAKTSAYNEGDYVYTAGSTSTKFESRFPPDIPVGIVTRIDDENTDTQVVHVRALADLRRLDNVTVLTAPEANTDPTTTP
jgi:rod shape-determining protein MreC